MAVVKNLMVRSGADFSQLYREMNKAQRQLKGFKRGVTSALSAIGVTLSVVAVGNFIRGTTQIGSSVAEVQNVVNVTFGRMAQDIEDFAQTAMDSYGLSELAAKKYSSTLGAMLKSSKMAVGDAKDVSIGLTQLTADLASFYNLSTDEVFRKIMSGMTGMTRPLKDLGINMDVATLEAYAMSQGIGKSYKNMTQAEKAMLRYNYLLSVTGDQQGDFARNAHNWAHSLKTLGERWNTLKATIGRGFINVLQPIVTWLNAILKRVQVVAETFRAFTVALFGDTQASKKTGAAASYIAEALGEVADGYEDAEAAGKKAKGALAGFDEIHQLADQDTGGGPGGLEGFNLDDVGDDAEETGGVFDAISEKIQAFADKFKGAFDVIRNAISSAKDFIQPALAGIAGAIAGLLIVGSVTTAFKTLGIVVKAAWTLLLGNPLLLVAAAVGALAAMFVQAYQKNEQFRETVDRLWAQIKDALTPAMQQLGEVLAWLWQSVVVPAAQFIGGVLQVAFEALGSVLVWLWRNVLLPVGGVIVDVLVVAFNKLVDIGKWLWQHVLQPLGDFLINSFIPGLLEVGKVVWDILKPIIEGLIKVFEFLWYDVLKPISLWLGDTFKPIFENIGQGIKDIISGLQTTFEGLINFITGVFTGDWKRAWEGVKQIFKGVFDSLWGIVKVPLNLIIDGINWVIGGLNKLKIDIPDWVKYVPGLSRLAGQTWGINIPKIPKLARGGVIDSPTIAMLGERGAEAVVPLENTSFVDTLASALGTAVLQAMQVSYQQPANDGPTIIQIDGTTLGRVLKPYLDREEHRLGSKAIIQPV